MLIGCIDTAVSFRIEGIDVPATASTRADAVLVVHYLGAECGKARTDVVLSGWGLYKTPPEAGTVSVAVGPSARRPEEGCDSEAFCHEPGIATRSLKGLPVGDYFLQSRTSVAPYPVVTATFSILP